MRNPPAKTTLKELIHQSLLRELDEPGLAKSDTTEPADVLARVGSADAAAAGLRPQGHDVRECSPPSPIPAEKELPYYRHPKTGFLVSRRLNDPGFVPPTAEESQAMIERANEEEDLRRAGLLR